jgi:hypothetical protein
VLQYLQKTDADHVDVILKAREPARLLVVIGGEQNQRPHLELKQRWVNQYNFYLTDQHSVIHLSRRKRTLRSPCVRCAG